MKEIIDHIKEAIRLQRDGKYEQALDLYNLLIKMNVEQTLIYYNLSLIYIELGDFDSASAYINKAIALDPGNVSYLLASAHITLMKNDLIGTLELIKNHLHSKKRSEKYNDFIRLLSAALNRLLLNPPKETIKNTIENLYNQKKFDELIEFYESQDSKITFFPETKKIVAEAYCTVASLEKGLKLFEECMLLNPLDQESQLFYAKNLLVIGKENYSKIEKAFQQAALIDDKTFKYNFLYSDYLIKSEQFERALLICNQYENFAGEQQVWMLRQLGLVHVGLKDYGEAEVIYKKILNSENVLEQPYIEAALYYLKMTNYVKAADIMLKLSEFDITSSHSLALGAAIFQKLKFEIFSDRVSAYYHKLIQSDYVKLDLLMPSIMSLFDAKYKFEYLKKRIEECRNVSQLNELCKFLNDEVFLKVLEEAAAASEVFEKFAIALRLKFLEFSNGKYFAEDTIALLEAVAVQTYLNEFIWRVSTDEKLLIEELFKTTFEPVDASIFRQKIGVLACYKRVDEELFSMLERFGYHYKKIKKLHFDDHKAELKIYNDMSNDKIDVDFVSKNVREMYEENPYPRWRKLYVTLPIPNINRLVSDLGLKPCASLIEPRQILIAGCGTGRHAITTASRFPDSDITAIDISRRSLAYAIRQAKENGISRIRFSWENILNLSSNDNVYDLIESSGVLHHMDDPSLALSKLSEVLKSGGLIKLGLYSSLARANISMVRNIIAKQIFAGEIEDIRNIRDLIFKSEDDDLAKVAEWNDFYTTSMCRDLLFHRQEITFNLIEIKELLKANSLTFVGFEIEPSVSIDFQRGCESKDDLFDLEKWNKFEQQHPETFKGMYQFWCQKI